ncbi:MAG: phosphate ABC transporter permease subunit PstC [Candidatus Omnitrophota bacterium]|nr:MAG: phosphate ABC transporter permease subunit PstC [Candidatus Omnitrophota bacterium]
MKKIKEFLVENSIRLSGIIIILVVILIFIFLFKNAIALFQSYSLKEFLTGKQWYPISEPPKFGIVPLLLGSLLVTVGASIISIPLGISCAVFISEIAPQFLKDTLKALIELLAAIPSVVLGFVGMVTLVPFIRSVFNLPTGLTALSGSIMLALMAMPTIVSIAEDALNAVPKAYKEGAYALGATKWQVIHRVILPAAFPGLVAAIMLGIGRVIGETMAVMMITGNAARIPHSFLEPVRTMTATIAAEMGETVRGDLHYFALFAIGLVLFLITFFINLIADIALNRSRR